MSGPNITSEGGDANSKATTGLLTDLRGSGSEPVATEGTVPVPVRKRMSTQSLVLVLVLAASAAALYTMRKQGMAAGLVFQPVKLDYEPEKLKTEDAKAQQKVMAELARTVAHEGFTDEPLRKNPFRMDSNAAMSAASGPDPDLIARTQREEEIRTKLAQLALNGVMMGPTPLARIAGKTYTVSDTIDGLFMVTEIRDRSVDLMVDEKIYTLQMSDTSAPAGAGGRRPNPGQPNPVPPRR
jgi:hypothetical protein